MFSPAFLDYYILRIGITGAFLTDKTRQEFLHLISAHLS